LQDEADTGCLSGVCVAGGIGNGIGAGYGKAGWSDFRSCDSICIWRRGHRRGRTGRGGVQAFGGGRGKADRHPGTGKGKPEERGRFWDNTGSRGIVYIRAGILRKRRGKNCGKCGMSG